MVIPIAIALGAWVAWGIRLARRNNADKLTVLRRLDGKKVRLNLRFGKFSVVSESGVLRVSPDDHDMVVLESDTEKTHVVPLGQIAAVFRGRSCVGYWD